MRVRDHIVFAAAGGAALRLLSGRDALGFVAGGVLIDVDHYVWFCLHHRRLNPLAAVRFFNEADPPQHQATRFLHSPAALLSVLILGARLRALRWTALGMTMHVALDAHHAAQMKAVRSLVLRRDDFTCLACGTKAAGIGTHIVRQPRLLPSYAPQNLVSLCGNCHELAHMRAGS